MKHPRTLGFLIGIGVTILITVAYVLDLFTKLEMGMLDVRFHIRGEIPHIESIVVVAIDDDSIEKLGRWPWERKIHAKLINRLTKAGAKSIAFDIFFTEPDTQNPENDQALIQATRRSGRVIHNMFFDVDRGIIQKANLPMPSITRYASGFGYANVFPEMDGVIRKIPLSLQYEDVPYFHLSLMLASKYLGISEGEIIKDIPVDENNEMLVNYAGGFKTFPYVSYYQVLDGSTPAEFFKDKMVIVGFAATGHTDLYPIPFAPAFPGVEIHVNAINNYINKNFLKPQPKWLPYVLLPIFGIGLGLILPHFSPWLSSGFAGGVLILFFLTVQIIFSKFNLWIESVTPLLLIILTYGAIILMRFLTEEKEKRRIKKTFGQYVSHHVMEEILSHPDKVALGGRREVLSVLFSDIRGFTTISEGLSPEEVVALLNEYLSEMTQLVFKYEGTLDKFIGDAVMAFWGAPIPQEDHARRSIFCALEMIHKLKSMQESWKKRGKPIIDIGIGVNTGDMVIGNMGSIERMDYTVIGDNVNLASRLEGLNKQFSSHIIISESTYNIVKDLVKTKPLGGVKVKGKEKEVEIFQVLSDKEGKFIT